MTLAKREHPEARAELREAALWYEDREPGLGEDFYNAVDEAIARISNWPHSAPVFPRWAGTPTVRSMAVSAFPYRVLYLVAQDRFVILAYAHERRKPGYWHHRIET
ncbi:MAG: type II toxin-antitoxin system RelE/ParE family toxin [Porphyromonadaceae bacterium]|nr:type II toxin-antitoxin system RelE/ParE family toxin [Porphyromonadaceae bacterium]